MLTLVLASQSPRRRDLLREAGYEFVLDPVKVSEIIDENLNPEGVVLDLAKIKAQAALRLPKYSENQDFLILSADTLVFLDDVPLGKPKNIEEAKSFLSRLSGRTHSVMTGVYLAVSGGGPAVGHVEITTVEFRKLSAQEIDEYVASGDPMDKAGAYGFQGPARKFVSRLEGLQSNVIGLPVEILEGLLKKNGWTVHRRKS